MKDRIIRLRLLDLRRSIFKCWYIRPSFYVFLLLTFYALFLSKVPVWAHTPLDVNTNEQGENSTGLHAIWHDKGGESDIYSARQAHELGEFRILETAGSTGLSAGVFWSHFTLRNRDSHPLTLNIEYVDHQLVGLQAFSRKAGSGDLFREVSNLSIYEPFTRRQVAHNRFVFPVTIAPEATQELMVRFDSGELGVVFPSLRIWSPQALQQNSKGETSLIAFLFGGYFLMAVFALVGAIAIKEKILYIYSFYCASKILVWGTVLGYTHQYLMTGSFHWGYGSLSGAVAIMAGLVFARTFLETRQYTPKLDFLLQLMLLNGAFLIGCVFLELKALSQISMIIALLCYPLVVPIAMIRWRQGENAAGVFALGWATLVLGLLVQAMRDLGYVVHNPVNYYWPPVASFVEMLAIMAAIGLMVQRLRLQKDRAEKKYLQQLEVSKIDLEELVQSRTRELEAAKARAELEARTDPLTGIHNRRSFFEESNLLLKLAQRKQIPLGILMLDIDRFKSINDCHGHLIGDQALCATARVIAQHVREVDVFGRIGGEEFALLVSADGPGTLAVAKRIHEDIAKIMIKSALGPVQFTASIGVAQLQGERDVLELLQHADSALYRAKRTGRNRVLEYAVAEG
ncbi:sensor domain-containing diguanylate cyclase [Microbulbifer variabilis]|uniref:diguanylate cyclase n=1 Tax=Microbulbifer variabilis TaxID=266805 RepID=A0ABY4VAN1_9GAMM|nr:diguanylate cyclase [Microbulbifer variabilis]USD21005.1 sensor domain-containing diguanylate cyclase [Microbulbifer variabilis]